MTKFNKATGLLATLVPATVMGASALAFSYDAAYSATDETADMNVLLGKIVSWVDGPLGSIMAVAALAVGLGLGIIQQSIIAAVIGVGFAAVVNYGPAIVQGIAGSADSSL